MTAAAGEWGNPSEAYATAKQTPKEVGSNLPFRGGDEGGRQHDRAAKRTSEAAQPPQVIKEYVPASWFHP